MSATTSGRFFPVQTFALGPGSSFANFYPALELYSNGQYPQAGTLGMIVEQNGKVYRLVQFDNGSGNVAAVVGAPAYWLVRASWTVTSDESDGESLTNGVAGGFLAIVTDLNYCWLQIGGLQAVVTDGNAVAGAAAIGSGDAAFATMTVSNTTWVANPVGIFNAADVSTAGTMYWLLGAML